MQLYQAKPTAHSTPSLKRGLTSFRHAAPATRFPQMCIPGRAPHHQRMIDGVVVHAAATEEPLYGTLPGDSPSDSYVTLVRAARVEYVNCQRTIQTIHPTPTLTKGMAHCFVKDSEGKLMDQYVLEPIAAPALECMAAGGATSFMHVWGTTFGEVAGMNKAALPVEMQGAAWCDDFVFRLNCACRTWMRPDAQDNLLDLVPLGKLRSNFNVDLTYKRVLNMEHIVNDADNIKQDISIDVYGRKTAQDAKEKAAANVATSGVGASKKSKGDDNIDDLLSM